MVFENLYKCDNHCFDVVCDVCMYKLVTDFNACISHPCQHGGRCTNTTHAFKCKCKGNHEGSTCSSRFYAVPISVWYKCTRICSLGFVLI